MGVVPTGSAVECPGCGLEFYERDALAEHWERELRTPDGRHAGDLEVTLKNAEESGTAIFYRGGDQ